MNELICPVCKNKIRDNVLSGGDYISGEEFSLIGCFDCEIVVTDFGPDKKNLGDYYGDQYYGNRKSLSEDVINRLRIRQIFKIAGIAPRKLLDIGCGNGSFFMKFRELGWLAFGTELAPPEHLKNGAGEFIYKGDLMENSFESVSFELVTMWHSLEHISNPLEYMKEALRILKDGGVLIAEVPNFRSWQSQIFKENWFHLDVPRHLMHFSPKGLAVLLQKAGFRNVEVTAGSFIYQIYGYLQSILNFFSRRKNMLFDLLNGKIDLTAAAKAHPIDLIVNIILFLPAAAFSLIFSVLEILSGRSGIILVSAKK
ncbi:MAG: class I SAM-dependent methyltransferase [bacterium]|nr:class I SAM-dependent methyltransferase [bacterium]